jgi:hypothetical protein
MMMEMIGIEWENTTAREIAADDDDDRHHVGKPARDANGQ